MEWCDCRDNSDRIRIIGIAVDPEMATDSDDLKAMLRWALSRIRLDDVTINSFRISLDAELSKENEHV